MKRGEVHEISIFGGSLSIVGHHPSAVVTEEQKARYKSAKFDLLKSDTSTTHITYLMDLTWIQSQLHMSIGESTTTVEGVKAAPDHVRSTLHVGDAGLEVHMQSDGGDTAIMPVASLKVPPVIEQEKIVGVVFLVPESGSSANTVVDDDNKESKGILDSIGRAFSTIDMNQCDVSRDDDDWMKHPLIGLTSQGGFKKLYVNGNPDFIATQKNNNAKVDQLTGTNPSDMPQHQQKRLEKMGLLKPPASSGVLERMFSRRPSKMRERLAGDGVHSQAEKLQSNEERTNAISFVSAIGLLIVGGMSVMQLLAARKKAKKDDK